MADRLEAERRVRQVHAFRRELDALAAAHVLQLTDEQRAAVDTYHDRLLTRLAREHDVDRSDAARQLSAGMRLTSFFAAVALLAAIFSLVAHFWSRFDLPLQAALLCAFPLMALVGVELSARRERTLYVAAIFALVACGTYWLAAVVLSERLTVPLTPPVVWGGALFSVALSLPYGFRLVWALGLLAMLVALAGTVFQAAGMPWTQAFEHVEVLTLAAALMVPVAAQIARVIPMFGAPTRLVAWLLTLAGLLVLSTAGTQSLLPLSDSLTEILYQALTTTACLTAMVLGIHGRQRETVTVAATAFSLFLLIRFVDWFWTAIPRYLFFLLLAAMAFAWLAALRRLRARLPARELA